LPPLCFVLSAFLHMVACADSMQCFAGMFKEMSCLGWKKASLSDLQRARTEAKPISVRHESGSELWRITTGKTELLHVALDELLSPRAFYERFLSDAADFSILDMDSKPWNTHCDTSDLELDSWSEDGNRKMRFLAYPVIPGFPLKYVIRIEQCHKYQFVMDKKEEVLQFESIIRVYQTENAPTLPYADCFTMRQLWTVRQSANNGGQAVGCDLTVDGELNFIGRKPLAAPFVRRQAFAEHREGTQGWLAGARASLKRLPGTHGGDVAIDMAHKVHVKSLDASMRGMRSRVKNLDSSAALLLACLVFVLMFMAAEASGNPAKVLETSLVPYAVAARVDNIVGFSLSSFFC